MCEKTNKAYQNILVETMDCIAVITMNRPKALNALCDETLSELDAAFTELGTDKNVLGVIITGAGKGFAAGADINQMKDYSPDDIRAYTSRAQSLFNKIESFEKPVIAAVNGFALGGGCELSMSCDWRIASVKAKFGQPEAKLGVIPCFGGTQRLPRLVGLGLAKELIFTGRVVSADEAKQIGLVNQVVAEDELMSTAISVMKAATAMAPLAIRYAKIALNASTELDLVHGLEFEKDLVALTFTTQDHTEGIHAFLEKRDPHFEGC